jgi:glycosyl transferase family 25
MFEFIEKVVYINLTHRIDRREQIEKELSLYFPPDKIIRFNAIKDDKNGNIGCSKSHIAVLEMAIQHNWSNVLIVEDDAVWNQIHIGYPILATLVKNPYDVICIGSIGYAKANFRIIMAQTTTAYLVSNHYYKTLLQNYREGLMNLLNQQTYYGPYCIDQYWKILQQTDLWFRVHPTLMCQSTGYSDIAQEIVDYSEHDKRSTASD